MSTARESILARIRGQLPQQTIPADAAYNAIARTYAQRGSMDHEAMIDLLIDRLVDYDSDVIRLPTTGDVGAAVATLLAKKGETRLIVPPAINITWLPVGATILRDTPPLTDDIIESSEAVLTACEVAVASTGTIFLRHTLENGRRSITLLPDHHICVVREDQVVETIPESFVRMRGSEAHPITTISGPSATADIEMTRIRGVHGPRRLSVILVGA